MRFGRLIFTGVLIGLGACVFLNFTQQRRQADQLLQATNPLSSPSPSPLVSESPTPTPSPTNTPAVAGQASVKLALFSVQITVADPITDLVYGGIKDGKNTWAGFTTEALLAKYPGCKAGALGTLIRIKASPTPTPTSSVSPSPSRTPAVAKTPSNQPFKKTVDGYIYSYKSPSFGCVTDQAGRNTVAAAVAALKNQALPTMSSTSVLPTVNR